MRMAQAFLPVRRRDPKSPRRKIAAAVVLLLVSAALASQAPFVYRRFYLYPRTQAALHALERSRAAVVPRPDGLVDYRGVIHAHSHLSHDSMGTTEQIIAAARKAGVDFIFMTDHYGWLTDGHVISEGLRGEHSGVFFVVGAEMRDGVMPFFLERPPARYNPHQPLQDFVNELRAAGALVFLTHPDDPRRRWDLKGWSGMEIYNLHADARRAQLSPYFILSEQFWSLDRYPMLVFRNLFREPREYLALWDRFTQGRKVVGIAGNDAHQNNGLRLVVTHHGSVVLTDTSGADRAPWWEGRGRLSRALARAAFGELTPGRTLWRTDTDLYERSFRFVNTHLLARAKNEPDLRRALEDGHAYVAFDSLVTATGFSFSLTTRDGSERAILGDELPFEADLVLRIDAPVSATLRLVRDGRAIHEQRGRQLRFPVRSPGVYRAEAHLEVRGKLLPWIYSNCIYIR